MKIFLWISGAAITVVVTGMLAFFRYSDKQADEFDEFLDLMHKDG